MKAILQRVTGASVTIDGTVVGCIQDGLLVLLGIAKGDQDSDVRFVVDKIRNLRIFSDDHGKMNRSLAAVDGSVLLVSQFTLLASTANGRRPSFDEAAPLIKPSSSMNRSRLGCENAERRSKRGSLHLICRWPW